MGLIIGTPYAKGAGYFVNDRDLRTRQQADVRTCTHCQAVILMQDWKKNGAWCRKCFAPICLACGKRAEVFGCEPFLKKIEQYAEEQMRFAKIAGLMPEPQQSTLTGK